MFLFGDLANFIQKSVHGIKRGIPRGIKRGFKRGIKCGIERGLKHGGKYVKFNQRSHKDQIKHGLKRGIKRGIKRVRLKRIKVLTFLFTIIFLLRYHLSHSLLIQLFLATYGCHGYHEWVGM